MSEPRAPARSIRQVVPGIFNWHVPDDRIGARSDAWAVVEGGALTLIDPLPLGRKAAGALVRLGRVEAICLTGSCHQRSAWRFRDRLGGRIFAPEGAVGLEGRPDVSFEKGDRLPGGLAAIHTPGPTEVHYSFLRPRGGGAIFCADLMSCSRMTPRFIPAEYQDEPARTRESVRKLLALDFRVVCFAHGGALTRGAKTAIRAALRKDAGGRS